MRFWFYHGGNRYKHAVISVIVLSLLGSLASPTTNRIRKAASQVACLPTPHSALLGSLHSRSEVAVSSPTLPPFQQGLCVFFTGRSTVSSLLPPRHGRKWPAKCWRLPQVPDLIFVQLRVMARSMLMGTGDRVNRLPRWSAGMNIAWFCSSSGATVSCASRLGFG